MKKIVIIGANDFQNPLILKAKELGYETHVFAWKDGSIGEETADFFYPVSIVEKDEILKKCREIKPDAVATIASDLANVTVNYLSKELGLICNSEETLLATTNKYRMRQVLKNAGIPTPEFAVLNEHSNLEEIKKMSLPLIVKPTDRSGSRGIMKITEYDQIGKAVRESIDNSFEKRAIVEEFIEGEEFSCECISYQGKHFFLAVTRKFTTGSPHYIETGHIEPAGLSDETVEKIKLHIFASLDALGVAYGASHSEFKINPDGNIRIIEIGSRMGGDCIGSHLVQISTGYDFLKMVLDTALGFPPEFLKQSDPKVALIRFIVKPSDVDKLKFIKMEYPNMIRNISEIDVSNMQKVTDSSSRYGFYILACENLNESEKILEFLNS